MGLEIIDAFLFVLFTLGVVRLHKRRHSRQLKTVLKVTAFLAASQIMMSLRTHLASPNKPLLIDNFLLLIYIAWWGSAGAYMGRMFGIRNSGSLSIALPFLGGIVCAEVGMLFDGGSGDSLGLQFFLLPMFLTPLYFFCAAIGSAWSSDDAP